MFAGERRDRGGTRGGQAEFKWSDVKDDKHRENYLGHSLNAPVGRWQNKRDLQWFSRDKGSDDAAVGKEELKRRQEMTLIKQQEQEAMSLMLRGEQVPNRVSLSTKELSSLLKKGHDEDDSLAAERIKGVGFQGGNANLTAVNAEAARERLDGVGGDIEEGSESRSKDANSEPSKQKRKEMRREAKEAKKLTKALKKEKKRNKRSKHNKHSSDDSDSEMEWTERTSATRQGTEERRLGSDDSTLRKVRERAPRSHKDTEGDISKRSRHRDDRSRGKERRGRSRSRSESRDRGSRLERDRDDIRRETHHHRRGQAGNNSKDGLRSRSRSSSSSRASNGGNGDGCDNTGGSDVKSKRSARDRAGERDFRRRQEHTNERSESYRGDAGENTHRHSQSHRRHRSRSRSRSRNRRSMSRERRNR